MRSVSCGRPLHAVSHQATYDHFASFMRILSDAEERSSASTRSRVPPASGASRRRRRSPSRRTSDRSGHTPPNSRNSRACSSRSGRRHPLPRRAGRLLPVDRPGHRRRKTGRKDPGHLRSHPASVDDSEEDKEIMKRLASICFRESLHSTFKVGALRRRRPTSPSTSPGWGHEVHFFTRGEETTRRSTALTTTTAFPTATTSSSTAGP